ncbi:MAG TPA: hypothetical protein VHW65_10180 [Gemmatimonadales bacterium]|nr:hypothetical protein [Gemmatimonadales bacterium]
MRWLPVAVLLLCPLRPVRAQDTTRVQAQPAGTASDTTVHRPSPMHYFVSSLLIPGLGQAELDRKLTGAIFVAFEGVSLSMALKANSEIGFYQQIGDTTLVAAKRLERQDWYVLLAVNHLFSALEAYVSAHLLDFPRDLKIRPIIGRQNGIVVNIGIGH